VLNAIKIFQLLFYFFHSLKPPQVLREKNFLRQGDCGFLDLSRPLFDFIHIFPMQEWHFNRLHVIIFRFI